MTEEQRWQWWIRSAAGVTVVAAAGMVVAWLTHSRTVLALALGLLVLLFLAAVAVSRRPAMFVPPPLQGLDSEQRRLVAEAVKAGRPAPDPALAGAVHAMGRRLRTGMILFLCSAAIGVYLRIDSLVSGGAHPAFDLAFLAFWVVTAAAAARALVRGGPSRHG